MQSIRIKLILIPLTLIILFLALASLTYWYTREIQGDGAVINRAGKLRMLSQMITKEALEIKFYSEEDVLHIAELGEAMEIFEQSLQALINGDVELNIPPTKSPIILNKLTDLSSYWNELKPSLAILLNYEDIENEEFMNAINVVSSSDYDLLEMSDSIVNLYEMESNKKVDVVLKILSWSIPIVLIILALGWKLAHIWVISPLVKVSKFLKERKTLEDYREKVPFHFNNEIGMMIDAINEAGERVVNITDSLKVSETEYKNLVGNAEDAIISINHKGNIIFYNKSAEKLFGYKTSEIMEKNITTLMPEEFREAHKKGLIRFLQTEKPEILGKPIELDGLAKSGEVIPMSVSIWSQKGENGYSFTAILRDAREGKRKREEAEKRRQELANAYRKTEKAYKELKDTQSQLLQSEKMASIGQLAAGVAHEINNPIGFINSNLSVLGGYGKDIKKVFEKFQKLRSFQQIQGHVNMAQSDSNTAQGARNIQNIWKELDDLIQEIDLEYLLNDLDNVIKESQEGTERVKKIVKDLRDFSHPGEPELKYGDVNKGLESTLNIVRNEIKYKAEVIKDFGELPEILCYPMQLNQVFMNILLNAGQAIEKGGEIRIVTRDLKNNFIEVSISDNGTGICKENLNKIFNPFFTTKKVGEGTGLGLSMAYGIIQKHGGTIQVESEEGKGSSFVITLPVGKIDE